MHSIIDKYRIKYKDNYIIYNSLKLVYGTYKAIHSLPSKIKLFSQTWQKISVYKKTKDKTCWFLCVPIHGNLGDQAMAYAGRKWIQNNYPEYSIVELTNRGLKAFLCLNTKRLCRVISSTDIVFIQGGYTTGNKAFDEKVHRLLATKLKPENRLIFFPQTVFYDSNKEKEKTAKCFNHHKLTLFLARDRVSFETIYKSFDNIKVELFPDIVSSLIENERFDYSKEKNGISVCVRNDAERHYQETEINELINTLSSVTTVRRTDLISYRKINVQNDYISLIRDKVFELSKSRIVITDRFHGIIFSMLSRTKVIALDSADFKVREGAMMFSDLIPGCCYYAKDIQSAILLATELLEKTFNEVNYTSVCYDKFYSKLKDMIEHIDNA